MTLETRTDRQVPFDEAAEQQVLGALLIDRDAIFKIADVLAGEDFYIARHQRIYTAIYELLERRERIDTLTVQVELARREELDGAAGQLPASHRSHGQAVRGLGHPEWIPRARLLHGRFHAGRPRRARGTAL